MMHAWILEEIINGSGSYCKELTGMISPMNYGGISFMNISIVVVRSACAYTPDFVTSL